MGKAYLLAAGSRSRIWLGQSMIEEHDSMGVIFMSFSVLERGRSAPVFFLPKPVR